MRKISTIVLLSVISSGAALGLTSLPGAAAQAPTAQQRPAGEPVLRSPESLTWTRRGPANPRLGEQVVLAGDPTKAGPAVVRVRFPVDGHVATHSHPMDEFVTVVSGRLRMALGPEADRGSARILGPGGFFYMPAGSIHTVWAEEAGTVIDVFANGPFGINYHHPPAAAAAR